MHQSRKIHLVSAGSILLLWLCTSCVPPQNMVKRDHTKRYGQKSARNNSGNQQHFSWEKDDRSFFEENNDKNTYNRNNERRSSSRSHNNYMKAAAYSDSTKTDRVKKSPSMVVHRKPAKKSSAIRKTIKYKVKKGDTLYGISRKYGIPVGSLCEINNISNKNRLNVGTVLKVPASSPGRKQKDGKKVPEAPMFDWPVSPVVKYTKDGGNGVKSIGVYIQSKSGSTVRSSAPGVVEKTGNMRGFGNYVVIRHRNRYLTVYSNLEDVFVRRGQHIPAGKILGRMDRRESKLHFQINHAGKPEDPLKHLKKG